MIRANRRHPQRRSRAFRVISAASPQPRSDKLPMSTPALATPEPATNENVAPPDVRGFVLPASFAQRRLFFLDQLEPGNAAYNVPAAWRIDGILDAAILKRS